MALTGQTSCGPLVDNSVHIKHVKDVGDQEVIDATYQKEVRDKDAELRKDLFLGSEVPSPQQTYKCGSECRSNISLGEAFKRVKSMSFIRSPERAWCSCLEVRCTENCLRCLTHTREEEEVWEQVTVSWLACTLLCLCLQAAAQETHSRGSPRSPLTSWYYGRYGRMTHAPNRVHALIPRSCEYVTLGGNRDFEDGMKPRIMRRWDDLV